MTAGSARIPAIGLGTYPLTGEQCRNAVGSALRAGYRHVDTAQLYDNEEAVGAAIRDAAVPRSDVFLTTKIHESNVAYDDAVASVRGSLDRLGTGIDLLLVHRHDESVPIAETISAMNECQRRFDVEHVGVSNFDVDQLDAAVTASEAPIVTNQVAYNAYSDLGDLLATCRAHDVALTAFSPLAKGRLLDDETLATIGAAYGKTPAQVGLRWLVQQDGVVAIPKAADPAHQAENLAVFDFELTDAEMREIDGLYGGLTDRVLAALGLT